MYRNTPSVIIGRNQVRFLFLLSQRTFSRKRIAEGTRNEQNPWKEINLKRLKELGIPFVRRKSGGGTVYHVTSLSFATCFHGGLIGATRGLQDLGNTNYCVFVTRNEFNRTTNAELVSKALQNLSIPAYVNDRNDICVDRFKMSLRTFHSLTHEWCIELIMRKGKGRIRFGKCFQIS